MAGQTDGGGRVGILFALPEEARPFAPHPSGRVSVAISGVGRERAARSAEQMICAPDARLDCLLICGFAGGLTQALTPGSLVLADTVLYNDDTFSADSTLLAAAESVRLSGLDARRGTLATGGRILTRADEKRALAARTGAVAVDMETAGAARVAQSRGVPWLAVRAITDGVEDALPLDFNALADADGSVNRGRVVRATLARPWKIPGLIRLGARSARAANNLAAFLAAFLEVLPERAPK